MANGVVHQPTCLESEFTRVQARQDIGQSVFECFEQGEGGRVATNPLEFDKPQGVVGKMDEVDAALGVLVRIRDPSGDGALVEPARHVTLVRENGDGLLKPMSLNDRSATIKMRT